MDGYKRRMREIAEEENRRQNRKIGLIFGAIFAVVMFFLIGKEEDLPFIGRILFAVSFGWMGFNAVNYRGRYRPKIVYAVKICYPVILCVILLAVLGKI